MKDVTISPQAATTCLTCPACRKEEGTLFVRLTLRQVAYVLSRRGTLNFNVFCHKARHMIRVRVQA